MRRVFIHRLMNLRCEYSQKYFSNYRMPQETLSFDDNNRQTLRALGHNHEEMCTGGRKNSCEIEEKIVITGHM